MRPFFLPVAQILEHETRSDRHELKHAALLGTTGDAVITRLYECRERTEAEGYPESGIGAEVVLRFGTGQIGLRVVQSTTSENVGFGTRSRKGIDQIHERRDDAKVRARHGAARDGIGAPKIVVDAVEPQPNRQVRPSNGEDGHGVVPGLLNIAQFANRNGGASA